MPISCWVLEALEDAGSVVAMANCHYFFNEHEPYRHRSANFGAVSAATNRLD